MSRAVLAVPSQQLPRVYGAAGAGLEIARATLRRSCAMLRSANEDETAVHGCHFPGDMAVRMPKVLAIPRSFMELPFCFVCNSFLHTKNTTLQA